MRKIISRRQFLKVLAAITGGAGVVWAKRFGSPWLSGLAQELNRELYLPYLNRSNYPVPDPTDAPGTPSPTKVNPTVPPPPAGSRVVHMHSAEVTSWIPSDLQYWKYVNQTEVDAMVDQGIIALTGKPSLGEAWKVLLPSYSPGQKVAIKVSFNNGNSCSDVDGQIDAVAEPVNAIIRGLKMTGVPESDIAVYEAKNIIPDRFADAILYKDVRLYSLDVAMCRMPIKWTSSDPSAFVTFHPPAGVLIPPIRLPDVVIEADYLINMPIIKKHSGARLSLGFKNHFGTIQRPADLHEYIYPGVETFNPDYSPLVDIYQNPNIGAKTILIVGDGLFGARKQGANPELWKTFGNRPPNSLFFATDPVAIDCVMSDLLAAEFAGQANEDAYLRLAGRAGLGVFEHGDPWGSGYRNIDYRKVEL